MKRAERLYALVDQLRGARRPLSAARLSEEFEVSKRTIERDVQSLQRAGVPIYADHGTSGGYSILREHALPPPNLTAHLEITDEVSAQRDPAVLDADLSRWRTRRLG